MSDDVVIFVDDDEIILSTVRDVFSLSDARIPFLEVAQSGAEALEILHEHVAAGRALSVIVADYIMPGMKGDELLVKVHQQWPQAIKVMLTGQSDMEAVKRAINEAELYRFIEKPFDNRDLLLTVQHARRAYHQEDELTRKRVELERLNRQLDDYNRTLEQTVAERTRELSASNAELNKALASIEDSERIARHDLKTPLGSIAASARLLRTRGGFDGEASQLLEAMESASRRATAMVNLSLRLREMEIGTFSLVPETVRLGSLFDLVVKDLRNHAASKSIAVKVLASDDPPPVIGQESLCYSIMANLLKNAIEAAPDGATVTATMAGTESTAQLAIHNPGAIPGTIRERFFAKYGTHGKIGGTGLGAYSAKLMAEAQGGTLIVQSSDGHGTTLTLTLRRAHGGGAAADDGAAGQTSAERCDPDTMGSSDLSLLIVDDDEYNRMILGKMLPADCARVGTAVNGRDALEKIRQQRPDVVFLDIDMPVMGGFEALEAIRAHQQANGQAPSRVLAFSASDDQKSRLKYAAAGFDGFLEKPATPERVNTLLFGAKADPSVPAGNMASAETVVVDKALEPLLDTFKSSRSELLAELHSALSAGEREQARRLAHKLAGSLAMFGFADVSRCCEDIELRVVDGGDLAALIRIAGEVTERFHRTQIRIA